MKYKVTEMLQVNYRGNVETNPVVWSKATDELGVMHTVAAILSNAREKDSGNFPLTSTTLSITIEKVAD